MAYLSILFLQIHTTLSKQNLTELAFACSAWNPKWVKMGEVNEGAACYHLHAHTYVNTWQPTLMKGP